MTFRLPLTAPIRMLLAGAALAALAASPAASPADEGSAAQVEIGELLRDADGDTIPDALDGRFRVRGVVNAASASLQAQNYQLLIEDGSGGVSLFARRSLAEAKPGDVVEAVGALGQFRGAPQLFIDALEVVGHEGLGEPAAVPLAEADSWQHMGRRVRVEGLAGPLALEGHGRLRLDGDDGSALQVYVPQPVVRDFDWRRYPRGARLAVTGVVSIYKMTWPYDGGFQLVVTTPDDIEVLEPPTPRWLEWSLRASLPAAALLGVVLLLFTLVQRRQRARQLELSTLSALSATFSQPELDAVQLARRAGETLIAYGMCEAVLVQLAEAPDRPMQRAVSAARPELQQRLRQLQIPDTPLDEAGWRELLHRDGLHPLAHHALGEDADAAGWLVAVGEFQERLRAGPQRVLLAAVKLLVLALENRRIREHAERERAALHQLVVTDELTGLYNRRFLDEYLRVQIPVAARRGGGLAFLALDIDHFKQVNDLHGHPAGDAVLVRVAAAMRAALRSSDLPVRMGGEEFLVVAAESDAAGALHLGERLRAAVAAADMGRIGEGDLRVSVSVGVALFGVHGSSLEALIKASDDALYAAKRGGRNRVVMAAAPGPETAPGFTPDAARNGQA